MEHFLVTVHWQMNADSRQRLGEIIRGLERTRCEFCLPVVFPVHPRIRKMVESLGALVRRHHGHQPLGFPEVFLEFLRQENEDGFFRALKPYFYEII